jgi:hypothetical protein
MSTSLTTVGITFFFGLLALIGGVSYLIILFFTSQPVNKKLEFRRALLMIFRSLIILSAVFVSYQLFVAGVIDEDSMLIILMVFIGPFVLLTFYVEKKLKAKYSNSDDLPDKKILFKIK